ncbi:dTDP-4-dehydrorhamnose 3,5-epimerase [Desulforudis sp. 1088]|uniref:dTDP-4-dehydrorhamnose 3,5-epimerase n=1 Tax=unclassified Candidatus Desulforudis TaxID=2635950 RepID=UPI003CE4554A
MSFTFTCLEIPDMLLVEPKVFSDSRGFFVETYTYKDFAGCGITNQFVQDNHSLSQGPVLRGLHYQKEPMAQAKLVRCIRGAIFDVAVDIRRGSPTYGKWVGVELSAENKRQLYIPRGFAHGFCVLTDIAEVLYKVDNYYSPEHDRGIIYNDSDIGITWPVTVPILSPKDARHPRLKDADNNFVYTPDEEG